jgi:hypothetical protein
VERIRTFVCLVIRLAKGLRLRYEGRGERGLKMGKRGGGREDGKRKKRKRQGGKRKEEEERG